MSVQLIIRHRQGLYISYCYVFIHLEVSLISLVLLIYTFFTEDTGKLGAGQIEGGLAIKTGLTTIFLYESRNMAAIFTNSMFQIIVVFFFSVQCSDVFLL